MAFATLAGVNAALPGQRLDVAKSSFSAQAAGVFTSMWAVAGLPGAGATPSSGLAGDVPTDATAGALPFVNPASGTTHVARVVWPSFPGASAGVFSTLLVYDRLWHDSGISSTLTTGQTINGVALTRPGSAGDDAEAWWHVYAAMGAGTPTVTLAYTNSGGTAGRAGSSGVMATGMGANRTGPFALDAGDTGVRSIQTWTASATFTSGTIDLVIRRLVTAVTVVPFGPPTTDALGLGLPRVYDDACLELLVFVSSTIAISPVASIFLANG